MASQGTSMRIQIQLRIIADDDSVISEKEILHLDKGDDRLEAIGLSPGEAKALLAGIQQRLITAQAASVSGHGRQRQRGGAFRRCGLISSHPLIPKAFDQFRSQAESPAFSTAC